jgi:hypothetical protein
MTPEPGVLWTSDDPSIAGIAVSGDRIFVVTAYKLTSLARDGSDERVLAQTADLGGGNYTYTGAIAVNDTDVYWGGVDNLYRVPRSGGAVTAFPSPALAVLGVALDAAFVYWVREDATASGAVVKTPLGGGPSTVLATGPQGGLTGALALAGGSLYWASYGPGPNPYVGAALVRMPAAGGAQATVASDAAFQIGPDGKGGASWLGPGPSYAVVDLPPGASTPERTPLTAFAWVDAVTLDGTRSYFRDGMTGVVYALDRGASSPRGLTSPVGFYTSSGGRGAHLVVDGGQLFFAERAGAATEKWDVGVIRAIRLP